MQPRLRQPLWPMWLCLGKTLCRCYFIVHGMILNDPQSNANKSLYQEEVNHSQFQPHENGRVQFVVVLDGHLSCTL